MDYDKELRQRREGTPRYIPSLLFCAHGLRRAVARVDAVPDPGDKVTVTAILADGCKRKWGCDYAYIDSSLRMVIEGYHGVEAGYWEEVPRREQHAES